MKPYYIKDKKFYWTPVAVMRNGQLAFISVYARYDAQFDWFTSSIEGYSRIWHRRGVAFYNSRRECVKGIVDSGKQCG